MTTSLVYRPHVYQDEIVATPDLLIDSLVVASANARTAVPVDRLTMASGFQVAGGGSRPNAAIALIGAGAGMLISVASDHCGPDEPPGGPSCAKPLSRDVWRFAEVAEHADALVLSTAALHPDGKVVLVQQGSAGALMSETDLPAGRAVLCIGLEAVAASIAQHFEITLTDPVLARNITLRYEIVELTKSVC